MLQRKTIISGVVALVLILLGFILWQCYGSTTKIALVNFPGYQASGMILSNKSSHIRYDKVEQEQIDRFDNYDCVLVFGMGIKWNEEQRNQVNQLVKKGLPLKVVYAVTEENAIDGLDSVASQRILEYVDGANRKNYQSLAFYIRKYIDGKKWFAPEPEPWVDSPSDVFYHIDEQVAIASAEEFTTYLKKNGFYHEGAPKIVIAGGLNNPFGGSKENLDSLILSLDRAGLNVYPISSMMNRLDMIESVEPDLIIHMPHGRLVMGQGERTVAYLKEHNIPMLTALTIFRSQKEWEEDPMGLVGGFMSQTIGMPELDGAVYPYVLFTQEENEEGYEVVRAIPERLRTFTSIVKGFLALKEKKNADKHLAIYFFKGPGQESLVAQGLETVPSLYNLLLKLKTEGYDLTGLPSSVEAFRADLMAQAKLFEPYAKGELTDFIQKAKPTEVAADTLRSWIDRSISPILKQQLLDTYGDAPGAYFTQGEGANKKLLISRIQYGKVALLPQPMAGLGEDGFAIAHGAKMAPPYPYVGAYLWARNAFHADAIMHFGTHGSLEFTPQKQVALGQTDWADQLLGDIPHFYYYTIGNIGESMMAKRRSYATLVSYITPPFNESGARSIYSRLQTAIKNYYDLSGKGNQTAVALEVKKLAVELGLHRDLRLDSTLTKPYTDAEIEQIDNFAEEIASEKVNASLYTTGEAYRPERIQSTVLAMSVDPIAFSKAKLDQLRSGNKADYTANKRVFTERYIRPAEALVRQLLSGTSATPALIASYAGVSEEELSTAQEAVAPRPRMPRMMMAGKPTTAGGHPHAMMAGKPTTAGGHPHAMGAGKPTTAGGHPHAMGAGKPATAGGHPHAMMAGKPANTGGHPHQPTVDGTQSAPTAKELERYQALAELAQTIENVANYQKALLESPTLELNGIVRALAGGYIEPSSGGDAVANPRAVPTGRNLYSVNAETTPSERAWSKGVALAKQTLKTYKEKHGKYPTKISYTFWSSEFVETEGASIAQVLYMLGVEPIRDSFGRVSDLRLIPSEQLGRPRIDVVVQTSGQFRDLAASRLALITKAIEMATAAPKEKEENFVAQGTVNTEKLLVEAGMSPKEARELATKRIFGGINGMYGTGIQEMITAGDKWENESEIAEVYLNNMGASYATIEDWGKFAKPLFRAALANTDMVIQPRQNNTWGALSLDHVYEFMGGLNLTIRNVTGKDPDAYFADYRNRNNFRMQELKEAIGVEARATVLNPAYIKEMLQGGASSLGSVTEVITNTYGWNVAKPDVIDNELWSELYDVYVGDKFNLGVQKRYEEIAPEALQEATAVMLETIRKGMWKASAEQTNRLASLHAELTAKFGTTGSGFASGNSKLQDFIQKRLPQTEAKQYRQQINQMIQSPEATDKQGTVMTKEERQTGVEVDQTKTMNSLLIGGGVLALFIILLVVLKKKRSKE